jgi:hypothetical protein
VRRFLSRVRGGRLEVALEATTGGGSWSRSCGGSVGDEFVDDVGREFAALLQGVATQGGEPILTFLSPAEATGLVTRCGLSVVEDLDRDAQRERYLARRDDVPSPYTSERVRTAAVTP